MENNCCLDSLRYQSEPFEDEQGKPYCRWCGEYLTED
tara:strand:+ start:63179 stop:63289 length:111 start_codon:yes stop_codon:yes gene_type:complete